MTDLREQLAALAHEQWSGWMKYLFDRSEILTLEELTPVGRIDVKRYLLTAFDSDRWTRQALTPYADLPESEKNSDRKEADRVLALITSVDPRVDPPNLVAGNRATAEIPGPGGSNVANEPVRASLIALVERAMERIAALERVTGPIMPCCGEHAVLHKPTSWSEIDITCRTTGEIHEASPEYLAWKES